MTEEEKVAEGEMTVSEAGRLGGQTTLRRYGAAFMSKIGTVGGSTVARERGREYYARIGKLGGCRAREIAPPDFYRTIGIKGGNAMKAKYGLEYYAAIGRKGGNTRSPRTEEERRAASAEGYALRECREAAGLSQTAMASLLGTHQTRLSLLENGKACLTGWQERYDEVLRLVLVEEGAR